jgi:adenylate cyclase
VAVLAFANLSADPEQEFFCDGMAEEIINALAQVRGLRVVARTSAFAFKGKQQDVREIGGRLDVGAIVEGSVRKAGDRLRITAQLIDVRDGSHLWSERFDRRLEDVFAIQDEIALAVVEKLEVKLLGRERAAVVKRHTENLEAHNAFLVGLFEWNKMSPEGFVRCQELFQEAIDLDPEFAPPYAQLAESFTSVTWWSDQPPSEAIARAVPLIEKALDLSGGSSLTQCNLAMICYRLGDRQSGDTLFTLLQQRAQTGYVTPMFLAWLHLGRGEPEAALCRAEEALAAKDPWVTTHLSMSPAIVPADPRVDGLVAGVLP